MDAEAHLRALGWTGPGTGLRSGSRAHALLTSRKSDTKGLGSRAKESDQWWDTLFSAQLGNITVTSRPGSVPGSGPGSDSGGLSLSQINGGVMAAHPVAARAAHKRAFDGKSALERVFVVGETLHGDIKRLTAVKQPKQDGLTEKKDGSGEDDFSVTILANVFETKNKEKGQNEEEKKRRKKRKVEDETSTHSSAEKSSKKAVKLDKLQAAGNSHTNGTSLSTDEGPEKKRKKAAKDSKSREVKAKKALLPLTDSKLFKESTKLRKQSDDTDTTDSQTLSRTCGMQDVNGLDTVIAPDIEAIRKEKRKKKKKKDGEAESAEEKEKRKGKKEKKDRDRLEMAVDDLHERTASAHHPRPQTQSTERILSSEPSMQSPLSTKDTRVREEAIERKKNKRQKVGASVEDTPTVEMKERKEKKERRKE